MSPASAALADGSPPARRVLLAALASTLAALALYRATLLPGLDFGDTGSLQTMVGDAMITPRDGYPVYFAIGALFLRVTGAEPARALNLASAVEAAVACGLFVLVASELAGSLASAVAAAGLFASSYTFWSQAIIAEVYALHAIFVLLSMQLLLRWSRTGSLLRLAAFFACYALGFGNHLSMVLLAPGYTVFLLAAAPGGWRSMLRPRVVGLALGLACAGATTYLWNLRTLWQLPQPPATLWDALHQFWFDVTKSDWRETMVWSVPRAMLRDHFAMYWFDLRQQFGAVPPLLAIVGAFGLAAADVRRALLMALLYIVNVLFAFSYNVGDAHVFYLPSHLVLAILVAVGIATLGRLAATLGRRLGSPLRSPPRSPAGSTANGDRRAAIWVTVCALLLAADVAARAYHDFPALDRSHDRRPVELLDRLTSGLDDQRAILIADLNWQVFNGLSYYVKTLRPEIAVTRLADVLSYAPALVADNRAAGREIVVTERTRPTLHAAFGPLLRVEPDDRLPPAGFSSGLQRLDPGTRYVLCVLKPSRDLSIDAGDLARALRILGGGQSIVLPEGDYAAVAGLVGSAPAAAIGSPLPFRKELDLDGEPVEIRMDSWLKADTIRRMGFGHVVAARQHTLIVERGVSFVAFDRQGRAVRTIYDGNVFAPERRYLVSASTHP